MVVIKSIAIIIWVNVTKTRTRQGTGTRRGRTRIENTNRIVYLGNMIIWLIPNWFFPLTFKLKQIYFPSALGKIKRENIMSFYKAAGINLLWCSMQRLWYNVFYLHWFCPQLFLKPHKKSGRNLLWRFNAKTVIQRFLLTLISFHKSSAKNQRNH